MGVVDTIIFGSGLSAYFAKKANPSALVFSTKEKNASLRSNGFFRTKGLSNKNLFDSIVELGKGACDIIKVKDFCEFVPKINDFEEFESSSVWSGGFRHNLDFLRDFQKKVLEGQLLEIISSNGVVSGCLVEICGEKKVFYCKSIILCTGGFSNYFLKRKNIVCGIEVAFNCGAIVINPEFVLYHPFGYKGHVLPTESLSGAKLFSSKGKRLNGVEEILSSFGAHSSLSKIVKLIYSKNKFAFLKINNKKIKITPLPYYTLGGLWADSNLMSNIKGLFIAGECLGGLNGAERIGGVALSQVVYLGFSAGKNSANYCNNSRLKNSSYSENVSTKKSGEYFAFSFFNSKKSLQRGLNQAINDQNYFAQMVFSSALRRRESRGCFCRRDFQKKRVICKNNYAVLRGKKVIFLKKPPFD